jgi:hypothetical protein
MHDPTKLNIPRGSIQGGVRSLDPMAWNRVQKASKAGTHYTERRTKGEGSLGPGEGAGVWILGDGQEWLSHWNP